MKKATSTVLLPSWGTMSRLRLTAKESSRSRTAQSLPPCTIVTFRPGKQQGLWPRAIVRSGSSHEHSVHGQGLKEVRRVRRVGAPSLPRRQTFNRRGDHENLLRLPPAGESSRPRLHALRTIKQN